MDKSILVFVARDVAPCRILESLAEEIQKRTERFSVYTFLANGRHTTVIHNVASHMADPIAKADSVVIGMSSSEELAGDEIKAAKMAFESNIPVFCCPDTFGLRPHFREILSNRLTTLFCINEKQAEQAREEYPDLKVFVTGNPEWEKFFFPKLTREQSREKLGIGLEETVILLPAGKDVAVNIIHFNAAIESYTGDKVCHLIISLRPGDSTPLSIYQTLVDFAPENVKVRIVPASEMSASDILSGADGVFASASTLETEALCREKPIFVISFLSPLAKRRLKKATGSDKWELVEMGIVYECEQTTGVNLIDSISVWNTIEDSAKEEHIRKHFPKPERVGTAIDKMVNAIFS